ncbi:hypothetical protein KEM60_00145 [Austwickia sp. TVS 96-490-7B]|nr:hypothetical protein [Austwickia sp. TVS 96-490-7B]
MVAGQRCVAELTAGWQNDICAGRSQVKIKRQDVMPPPSWVRHDILPVHPRMIYEIARGDISLVAEMSLIMSSPLSP